MGSVGHPRKTSNRLLSPGTSQRPNDEFLSYLQLMSSSLLGIFLTTIKSLVVLRELEQDALHNELVTTSRSSNVQWLDGLQVERKEPLPNQCLGIDHGNVHLVVSTIP